MNIDGDTPTLPEIATKGSTAVAKPPTRFNFTKRVIEDLPSPTNGQRAYYWDSKTRGLTIAVSARRKTFVFYRKVQGRPERINIGPFPDLSIEQARGKASKLNATLANGGNPAEDRRGIREGTILGEAFARFGELYGKRKVSWPKMEQQYRDYLHGWALRRLSEIRPVDVVRLHSHIGQTRGPYAANRAVELLRSMFARAQEWGWPGQNPASGVKPFAEVKRDRFLGPEELPRFWSALAEERDLDFRDYVLLSLFTGARRTNVLTMRWEEINFERATWRIPMTKSGKSATVELIPPAIWLLQQRQLSATHPWVFASDTRSGHMPPPKTQWATFIKRAGLSDLRPHDLRRSHGSWEAISGASLLVIAKSLQQDSTRATEIYARLSGDPVRAAKLKAANMMLGFGGDVLKLGE